MPKVALIGAGSIIFATTLLNDMLGTECLQDATYALMGPTKWKLDKIETWAKSVIAKNKLGAKVMFTTDRRTARTTCCCSSRSGGWRPTASTTRSP